MKTPVFCFACSQVVTVDGGTAGTVACPDCGSALEIPTAHDVFISFSSADLPQARQVAAALRSAGVTFWMAPERIGLGESFVTAIVDALAHARVVVLLLSSHAVRSSWVEREISEAVSQRLPILPLKLEAFDVPREFLWLLKHNQWEDAFNEGFATHLPRLVARVQEELRHAAARAGRENETLTAPVPLPLAPQLEGVNPDVSPYVGPRPFPPLLADRFFGRQHEAEALLRLITASRVVLVYAPSGAGKSSLLNTAVTRSLEADGFEVLRDARVGGALPDNVRAAEVRNVFVFSVIFGLDEAAAPGTQTHLADGLELFRRRSGTRGRVVIFDQFEELFTQHPERYEDRQEFFDDVREALERDERLHVVLAMRQDFLADIEPLLAPLPPALPLQRFALRRMDAAGAREAIVQPAARYATFAPGVAEEIVAQLNTIQVPGFDGVMVRKRGEFIEMVHLQIVCERLWRHLPRGLTCIERAHVEHAAGDDRNFDAFVVNALHAFYDDTIQRVVNSSITRDHGGFSPELLRLGCMKFITPAATRTMVQRTHGRTGRLPDWIVEQLENCHLLRAEERGGQRWYELAHDRLAEPVGRQLDRKVSALLYAADLLDKVLERVLAERRRELGGYFAEHDDILEECQAFQGQAGLFADEAEFILRAALFSGRDAAAWSRRVGADFPPVRLAVLREALKAPSAAVRGHVAALLGEEPVPELLPALAETAVNDEDAAVRSTAALSLARLDRADLYAAVAAPAADPARGAAARAALARIRIAADTQIAAPLFEGWFAALAGTRRRRIRRLAWSTRAREGMPVIPFVVLPAAGFAAVAAAAFKWWPASFNWSAVQASPSAAMGIFHGVVAGVLWAGIITLALTIYHVVFGREHARKSLLRPFGAVVAGALGGVFSSLLVVGTILTVYDPLSLQSMGWLLPGQDKSDLSYWNEAFLTTRFGWIHLLTGTGLGLGMALTTNALRASRRWNDYLQRQVPVTGLAQARRLVREIAGIAIRYVWPLPVLVALAAVAAYGVPDTARVADAWQHAAQREIAALVPSNASPASLARGLAGDCATQILGAYFAIVGMGFGLVVMRFGLQVAPRRN